MNLFKKKEGAQVKAPKKKNLRNKALFKRGGYAIVITVVAVAATILLNFLMGALSDRFHLSFDISLSQENSISEENLEYIKGVDKKVEITMLATEEGYTDGYMDYYAQNLYTASDSNGEYYKQTLRLIAQYADYNDNITVNYVDPQDPEASELRSRYPSESFAYGDILVESKFATATGTEISRHKIITYTDIYELTDSSGMAAYGMGYYTVNGSNLETHLTSAIASVTAEEVKKIAFLTEHSDKEAAAYFIESLELNNYEVENVDGIVSTLPEGTDGVLIFAPKSDFSGAELDVISAYLNNNGKLGGALIYVASTDSPAIPNLSEFLQEWGIKQSKGILFETSPSYVLSATQPTAIGMLPTENDVFTLNKFIVNDKNVPFTKVDTIDKLRTVTVLAETSPYAVIAPLDAPADWSGANDADKQNFPVILMSTHTDYVGDVEESSYVVAFASADMLSEERITAGFGNLTAAVETVNKATAMTDNTITFTQKTISDEDYSNKVTAAGTLVINIIFMYGLPLACIALAVVVFILRRVK